MKGIRQLARHLDISIGTVSRALNGKADVNAETRERDLAAAVELGYVANQSGRSLRQGTTNVIGLMIESDQKTSESGDSFFLGLTGGLQTVLSRHKLDLIMLPCPREEDPAEYLQRMVARGVVDAMILSATQRVDNRLDFLSRSRIPFVTLGRSTSGGNYSWIDLDFEGVANQSVDRLVAHGHRRIAVAAPSTEINLGYVFLDGYRNALHRNGIEYDPSLVLRVQSSQEGGYQAADELLQIDNRPTAVVLVNELMALGLYRRLTEAGVTPGRDIAVVGFREEPRTKYLQPTLTCFRMSLRDLGIELAETLLSIMPAYASTYPKANRQMIWPLNIIAGDSDSFALEDR
jgi:DNA-binding LacI/PurR family transcriptional regulator